LQSLNLLLSYRSGPNPSQFQKELDTLKAQHLPCLVSF